MTEGWQSNMNTSDIIKVSNKTNSNILSRIVELVRVHGVNPHNKESSVDPIYPVGTWAKFSVVT